MSRAILCLTLLAAATSSASGQYTLQNVDISAGGSTVKSANYGATTIAAEVAGDLGTSENFGIEVILPITHGSTLSPVPQETPQIREFALGNNYPNPFNPRTTIVFDLPRQTTVSMRIFDVSGRLVRTLLHAEVFEPGRHQVAWQGRDDGGRPAASGAYFYRLEAGDFVKTRRMTLLK